MCGEHCEYYPGFLRHCGSSPRVWGAPLRGRSGLFVPRLIPTCVGSTLRATSRVCSESAHPHVCGEHSCSGYWFDVRGGSSPRVWGAPREGSRTGGTPRLIPTCVGSTRAQCSWYDYGAAHPHVCGEHQAPVVSTSRRVGSSPRVWGAHFQGVRSTRRGRLIPTCVGSTQ